MNDYRQSCYDFYTKISLKTTIPIVHQDVFDDFLNWGNRYPDYYPMLTYLTRPQGIEPDTLIEMAVDEDIVTSAVLSYLIHHPNFKNVSKLFYEKILQHIPSNALPQDMEFTLVATLCYVKYGFYIDSQKTIQYITQLSGCHSKEQFEQWVTILNLNEKDAFYPEGFLKNLFTSQLHLTTYLSDINNPFYEYMPKHIQLYSQYCRHERSLLDVINAIGTENKLIPFYRDNSFLTTLLKDALTQHEYEGINRIVSNILFYKGNVQPFVEWFEQASESERCYFIAMPKMPTVWASLLEKVPQAEKDRALLEKEKYHTIVKMLEPERVNGTTINRYWLADLQKKSPIIESPLYLS